MLLAIIVFAYTSFAIGINNNRNQNQFIGKSEEVKLTNTTKGGRTVEQRLTPLAIVVVILIAAVSTSPAYTSHGDAPPPPTKLNFGTNSTTLQQVALHNLD